MVIREMRRFTLKCLMAPDRGERAVTQCDAMPAVKDTSSSVTSLYLLLFFAHIQCTNHCYLCPFGSWCSNISGRLKAF